jgi:hypothetical protein
MRALKMRTKKRKSETIFPFFFETQNQQVASRRLPTKNFPYGENFPRMRSEFRFFVETDPYYFEIFNKAREHIQ